MKFLIIGDLHGNKPKISKKGFDAIIAPGDFCSDAPRKYMFEALKMNLKNPDSNVEWYDLTGKLKAKKMIKKSIKDGRSILEFLNSFDVPVYCVPGNWDWTKEDKDWGYLKKDHYKGLIKGLKNIVDVYHKTKDIGEYNFIGHGISSGPEYPQYKQDLAMFKKNKLNKIKNKYEKHSKKLNSLFQKSKKPIIFLSHNVPFNTPLDKIVNKSSPRNGQYFGIGLSSEDCESYSGNYFDGGISGVQIPFSGITIKNNGVYGGLIEDREWVVSNSDFKILAYTISGDMISAPGASLSGILTKVDFEKYGTINNDFNGISPICTLDEFESPSTNNVCIIDEDSYTLSESDRFIISDSHGIEVVANPGECYSEDCRCSTSLDEHSSEGSDWLCLQCVTDGDCNGLYTHNPGVCTENNRCVQCFNDDDCTHSYYSDCHYSSVYDYGDNVCYHQIDWQSQISVICSELNRQGYMPYKDMIASEEYSFRHIDKATKLGYHYWAKTFVKMMAKDKEVTNKIKPIGLAWGEHMAYEGGVRDQDNDIGILLNELYIPLNKEIGEYLIENNLEDLRLSEEDAIVLYEKYIFNLPEDEKELPKYLEENLPKLFNEGKNNIKFEEKKKVNIIKKLIMNFQLW